MKTKIISTVFLLCMIILTSNLIAQITPIDSLKYNNSSGEPLLLNQTRTIAGIVTASNQFTNPAYIQDATAGVAVYVSTFASDVNIGDSVVVTGVVGFYRGLTEMVTPLTYNKFTVGASTAPLVVTISQIKSQSCQYEPYEGRLLRVNNVKFTSAGTFTANTNYKVTSGNDTLEIRISGAANPLVGTLIPADTIAVVGLLGQYVFSAPYCGGYQLMPRFAADLITQGGGPQINMIPVESDITSTSVTLSFTSMNAGDTKVKYFATDSARQPVVFTDSVYNPAQTTNHIITLTNLIPGKIYYAQAISSNTGGISYAPVKYFSTASHLSSTGNIITYFNFPVDTNYAYPGNNANGNINLVSKLNQRIDSAVYSIDLCLYSFNELTIIKDRLIMALGRNVKIRMVYDGVEHPVPQTLVQDLINAGVSVSIRPDNTPNHYIMHNKFIIFDARDTLNYSNDWVWTGSMNLTSNQAYTDVQNVILIQDQALANTFTREFEQMFGSHTNYCNNTYAKFGSDKNDITPHLFNINGKRVECYFTPQYNFSTKIESLIDTETDKSINFLAFSFTRYTIANEMKGEYNPPFKMVRGVFDYSQGNDSASVYMEMKGIGPYGWNPPAKVFLDNYSGLMHSKYIIIDADSASSNPFVQTGSYNYTNRGTFGNDENVLVVFDSIVVNQYYQDFVKRLTDAGGSIGIHNITGNVPLKYELYQNYPNPFNPATVIRFSLPVNGHVKLSVYDILGREVSVLLNQKINPGTYETEWNASEYPSGVYFYTLKTDNFSQTKKMVLIK